MNNEFDERMKRKEEVNEMVAEQIKYSNKQKLSTNELSSEVIKLFRRIAMIEDKVVPKNEINNEINNKDVINLDDDDIKISDNCLKSITNIDDLENEFDHPTRIKDEKNDERDIIEIMETPMSIDDSEIDDLIDEINEPDFFTGEKKKNDNEIQGCDDLLKMEGDDLENFILDCTK